MVIYSLKAQNLKFIGALVLSAVAIVLIITLLPSGAKDYAYPEEVLPAVRNISSQAFKNISSNQDRIDFLKQFNWEVEPEAKEVVEVTIPAEFDAVYSRYNELQTGEGLDLAKYKGKTVKRYTYIVTNYEYNGTVYANILVYKDQVIGGDICSANVDGFVHGFTKSNDFLMD